MNVNRAARLTAAPPSPRPARRGITLMETVFAIGVILTGLLGLAALIPIAADNAKATLELDRSISEATSVSAAGVAREMIDLDSIVIYDKRATGSATLSLGYAPSDRPQTLRWKLEVQRTRDMLPLNITTIPDQVLGKLDSPGYVHNPLGSGLTAGICIDPLGMPALSLVGVTGAYPTFPNTATNAYDYSRFPYYSERHDPLLAPNNVTPTATSLLSPRMWRATLISTVHNDGVQPVRQQEMISHHRAREIFTGFAGLEMKGGFENDDPQSLVVRRTLLNSPAGIQIVDAERLSSADYTWFATLSPPIDGGATFRQSIVVVSKRVSPVPRQLGDPLALNDQIFPITEPDENHTRERLTWVGQSIGFRGGAGGEVLLYGTQAVVDNINPDEWVMLSRQPHRWVPQASGPPVFTPTGPAVHRWYRVLSVDDPQIGNMNAGLNEPNWTGTGGMPVWRRWVTLAGSDWSFGFPTEPGATDTAPNTLTDDTFCTLVEGAVAVYESNVQLDR